MGSPDIEEKGPVYDPAMAEYLKQLQQSLGNSDLGTPDRVGGEALYGAIGGTLDDIGRARDYYAQGGASVQDIQDRASAYVDPAMVEQMNRTAQGNMQQAMASSDVNAAMGGNMGSSRTGLQQAAGNAAIQSDTTKQMTDYYNQQIDRAAGDIQAAEEGFMSNVGRDVQYLQYMRELQQGDANAKWMGELIEQNPALLQGLLYSSLANSSPLGSTIVS